MKITMRTINGILSRRGRAVALLPILALPAGAEGVAGDGRYSTAHRHRVEVGIGYWDSGSRHTVSRGWWGTESSQAENVVGVFSYSYWAHDRIAPHVTFRVLVDESIYSSRYYYDYEERHVVITSAMFGARLYPLAVPSPLRPYVTVGVGPYIGVDDRKERNVRWRQTTTVLSSFGAHVGTGFDIQMGRHLMLGVHTGYNLMSDFEEPLAGERNVSGVEFGAGISLLI